jgi:DNA repair ATPase RecN
LEKLKASVSEFIDSHKKKSNSYWLKIKEALNKINTKVSASEKTLNDLQLKFEKFDAIRTQDWESINELKNAKTIIKNLVELKKSVGNIYENYQTILNHQKGLRIKLE